MRTNSKRSNSSAQRLSKARRHKPHALCSLSEILEPRTLLSAMSASGPLDSLKSPEVIQAAKTHFSYPQLMVMHSAGATPAIGSATVTGLTPVQIRGAYNLGPVGASTITFGGVQGDGSGQTIAIIDAYDDPTALNDLQHFDAQFGLPDPPSFTKLNEMGAASPLPGTDPEGPLGVTGKGSWELEESLDIEWSHVMAPQANIVLIECNSSNDEDLLINGAQTASQLPGVSVVSMSFGGPEFPEENGIDPVFYTPAGHNGVSFVASTGDDGSPSEYPAYSQEVLAVGGTTLTVNADNSYGGETGWSGSGGGISTQEYQPSFQTSTFTSSQRTVPDVSADADPHSGVAVYDSYDLGAKPWIQVGGTSLAAPLWGGMLTVVNQGRILNGLSTLNGGVQTLPLIYGLPASDFNDPTSGSNGFFSAKTGYDLVTGRGSPQANLVLPALASAAGATALPDLQPFQAFDPSSGDLWSAPVVLSTATAVHTDPTMIVPGSTIFLNASWINDGPVTAGANFLTDFQDNGFDLGAVTTTNTLDPGFFETITDLELGQIGAGITAFSMNIDSSNVDAESTETNNLYTRTYDIDATSNENYLVTLDPTGTNFEVFLNSVLDYSAPMTSVSQFTFYLSGTNQSVTIDGTNGNPVPAQGLDDFTSSSTDTS